MHFLFPLLFLFGCSSLERQGLDLSSEYRRDLKVVVRAFQAGKEKPFWAGEGKGVLVIPKAARYEIEGEAPGEFDLLVWQTCSQQHTLEVRDNSFEIDFIPSKLCNEVLEIRGEEEKRGRRSGAIIVLQDEKFSLSSNLVCNGEQENQLLGTSICQAREGLYQKIAFPSPVVAAVGSPDCPLKTGQEGAAFVFKMPSKKCAIQFGELVPNGKRHLLILWPYSDIVLNRKREE